MPKVVKGYRKQAMDTIMESASRLFFESGYQESSMDDIAREIGVTKGTLYLYFKNKEELLYEVCRRNTNLLEDNLDKLVTEDILESAKSFFKAELELPEHLRFHWIFALGEINKNQRVRKILLESYENYVKIISSRLEVLKERGLISGDADTRKLSLTMIALHNGIMMSMMQGLSEADASEIFEAGIRNILKNSSLYKN
ncbi:MAG: TetR family transcriptional regulator [Thermoplasmatales archaeon E-plasma]|jgi:AcrR family transcriptional regulator|nr:MAG: TetR family transcriptional regulator [Thermoplasmatales archaeon E-plasma]